MWLRILVAVYFRFRTSKGCILATFKVSADWALSNIRDFIQLLFIYFRIARFDFTLFHPLELFCLFFWYSLVSCVRIWFWSHIWFFFWIYLVFLDFQFHYLCLDLFPVLFGFQNPYLVLESHPVFFWVYIWFFSRGYFRFWFIVWLWLSFCIGFFSRFYSGFCSPSGFSVGGTSAYFIFWFICWFFNKISSWVDSWILLNCLPLTIRR